VATRVLAPRLVDAVRRLAVDRGAHAAVKTAGGVLSYAELDERSNRLAQGLLALGVAPGDRVAFLDRNGPEHIVTAIASAKVGAVFMPINFRLAPAEIASILSDAAPSVLLVGADYAAIVSDEYALRVIGGGGPDDYEAWVGRHAPLDPGGTPEDGDVVMLLYSSGTTGRPKGIELTAANLAACLARYELVLGLGADSVSLVVMPMFHVGGGAWALAGVVVGATNVIVRDFDAANVATLIAGLGVTHAALVPTMVQALLDESASGAVSAASTGPSAAPGLSSLQTIAYGAAKMPEPLLERALRAFPHVGFFQGYGLTETTSTVVQLDAADHDPRGPHRHRLRSVGRPVSGAQLRIVDPATLADVEVGGVGEIWIKGPTVMKGYWRAPDLTADVFVDGWLRSGDAGSLDADGYLYLHDRIKDMIVSGGENIYPGEIEAALCTHAAVREAAVVGVASDRWGETPKAFVVREPGAVVTEIDLIEHCRGLIARYKCPTGVEWIDELPRNASGKVLRRALRDL
jgi:acyl-CoA synthetase (AMP-forming)/AMP-acid ligase II